MGTFIGWGILIDFVHIENNLLLQLNKNIFNDRSMDYLNLHMTIITF